MYDNGTLVEQITSDVTSNGEYHMLYRYWTDPLYISPSNTGTPHIDFISLSAPAGTVGYAVGSDRSIYATSDNAADRSYILGQANDNELGAYDPSGFDAGIYPMEFSYVLHPPVQYDDQYAHINIKFMQDHPAIKNVHIVIPAKYVVSIYPHPPTLTVT